MRKLQDYIKGKWEYRPEKNKVQLMGNKEENTYGSQHEQEQRGKREQ
jgi:hypothetical protein